MSSNIFVFFWKIQTVSLDEVVSNTLMNIGPSVMLLTLIIEDNVLKLARNLIIIIWLHCCWTYSVFCDHHDGYNHKQYYPQLTSKDKVLFRVTFPFLFAVYIDDVNYYYIVVAITFFHFLTYFISAKEHDVFILSAIQIKCNDAMLFHIWSDILQNKTNSFGMMQYIIQHHLLCNCILYHTIYVVPILFIPKLTLWLPPKNIQHNYRKTFFNSASRCEHEIILFYSYFLFLYGGHTILQSSMMTKQILLVLSMIHCNIASFFWNHLTS